MAPSLGPKYPSERSCVVPALGPLFLKPGSSCRTPPARICLIQTPSGSDSQCEMTQGETYEGKMTKATSGPGGSAEVPRCILSLSLSRALSLAHRIPCQASQGLAGLHPRLNPSHSLSLSVSLSHSLSVSVSLSYSLSLFLSLSVSLSLSLSPRALLFLGC